MGRLILLTLVTTVALGVLAIIVGKVLTARSGIKRNDWQHLQAQARADRKALLDVRREASLYPDDPLSGVIIASIDTHLNREVEQ